MKFKSIGFKLIAGCCIAIIVPLAICVWVAEKHSSRSLAELSRKQLYSTAQDLAALVKSTVNERKIIAAALGADTRIRLTTQKVNTLGPEAASADIAALRMDLKEKFRLLGNQYLGIFVTNIRGELYTGELESGKEYKGSNVSSRDYFKQAVQTGRPVFGEVVRSKSTGKLIAVVCAPVLSEKGDVLGVLGMAMKASALTDVVSAKRIGKSGYAYMVNSRGVVIAHPNKAYVLSLDLASDRNMAGVADTMRSKQSGVVEYRFGSTQKLAGFAPVNSQSWIVAAVMENSEFKDPAKALERTISLVAAASLALSFFLILFTAKRIVSPINQAAEKIRSIAGGDLTEPLEITRQDELGALARSINTMISNFTRIFREVNNSVFTITQASGDLDHNTLELSKNAGITAEQANSVTEAVEQMSGQLAGVASASEQSALNMGMVAAAVEEMQSTVGEIAKQSDQARGITEDAVAQAELASDEINALRRSALEISKVTETINEISEQTNLLALNATIEAARAGSAGKGFAVVANEIKALARQTAEATGDIKAKIDGVQGATKNAVSRICETSKIISRVNESITTIAGAVEEQNTATAEISRNISQASNGIREVDTGVAKSSAGTTDIAGDIARVNTAVGVIAKGSAEIEFSVTELSKLSGRLKEVTGTFKILPPKFDIAAVKNAHMQWRTKLEGMLQGSHTLEPEEVCDHHQCEFGQWYLSDGGQALKKIPSFAAVGRHHEKVHSHARNIAEAYGRGEKDKAASLMAEFEKERDELFSSLDELYLE